ncbi:MAG: DinB family protein [Flavobacteriaceae bacterium]
MKKSLLFFAAIILFIATTNAQDSYDFKTSFISVLENAKSYTIEVAEAMPAEDYTFKATDSVRTFGEQMAHIGMSSMFIVTKLLKGEDVPESKVTEQEIGASKEKTIELLNMSFDNAIASLKEMNDEDLQETFILFFRPEKPEYTKLEGFIFLRDHITHHRGQAIIYLRMKGQKAPQFRAF